MKNTVGLTGIRQDDPRPQTKHLPVIQTDTSDSERCWLSTGGAHVGKDHHERERHNHACTQATEKPKLAIELSSLRPWTSHDEATRLVNVLLDARMPIDSPTGGNPPLRSGDESKLREHLLWQIARRAFELGLRSKTFEPTEA